MSTRPNECGYCNKDHGSNEPCTELDGEPPTMVRCDNCEWTGPESEANEVANLSQRVDAGGEMPAGECPKCGALVYEVEEQEPAPLCVYPDCVNSRRTRGLCHQHYQTWRSYARLGKAASDADLMKRGVLLPEGEGGSPVKSHEAFLKSSKATGKAVKT